MSMDILKKVQYMLNMESGANFEYLASVEERSGRTRECGAYLQQAQEKYGLAESNAVTDKEKEDSQKATRRVIDRIGSLKVSVR